MEDLDKYSNLYDFKNIIRKDHMSNSTKLKRIFKNENLIYAISNKYIKIYDC
jgi:hypothetical protein